MCKNDSLYYTKLFIDIIYYMTIAKITQGKNEFSTIYLLTIY